MNQPTRLHSVPPSTFAARNARLTELEAERADLLRQQMADIEARIGDLGTSGRVTFTVTEAAELCGVHYETARKWIKGGLKASRPMGGDTLIRKDALIEWLRGWE